MARVVTFEWTRGRLVTLREDHDAASASRALPRGAYTTLRTYERSRVLRLAAHLARLRESVAGGGALASGDLRAALAASIAQAGHAESRLRVTWSPPRLFVSGEAFAPLPEDLYARGVRCAGVEARRESPAAKDTAFIETSSAQYARLPPGVHEGLMVDTDGSVLEGLSSNVFFVLDGVLRTEHARVLPGVTRAVVLELAAARLPVELRAVRRDEVAAASECFLTSASREVLGVVGIDDVELGDGPGPVSRELRSAFRDLVRREAEDLA